MAKSYDVFMIKKFSITSISLKVIVIIFTSAIINSAIAEPSQKALNSNNRLDIERLAGLYWSDHKIDFAPFTKKDEVTVSDVLEIVPYDEQAAYIRTRLYFTNGHTCSLYGIAKQEGSKLSYYDGRSGRSCIMDIVPSATGIKLVDRTEECRSLTYGARGYYGTIFSTSKKTSDWLFR
jgi:ABC-type lipoprotein release transport system permease subunit